jgi:sulfite oxidase
MRQHFITPNELFFIRSHAPTPEISLAQYQLNVSGLVQTPLTLSLPDLQKLPRHTVTATLQCAGNRRDELIAAKPVPGEVPWAADGISTAVWSGVRLREVLLAAGVQPEAAHVAFTGADDVMRHGHTFGYGSSIALEKALSEEVLLADVMNGEPLTPVHGFPLRAVVPGFIGARSVKWLTHISVQAEPSDNYFQAKAYRLFAPHITPETVQWEAGLPLSEQSLNAVICEPQTNAVLPAGQVQVRGWAVAGGQRRVARVDVSADGGSTWQTAALSGDEAWTWQFWEVAVTLPRGETELVVRAWDTAANTMPEHAASVWNFKGYMNNAWHRVRVMVE